MKRQTSLIRLRRWVKGRLDSIRPLAERAAQSEGDARVRALTFVALDLHNTSAEFLRCYYLSSATRSELSDGSRTTAAVVLRNQREALTFAMQLIKGSKGVGPWPRRFEPAWHDTAVFLRVMNAAGCSTAGGANAAWSIGTQALEHLTVARNYFAHRNNDTAASLRGLSVSYKVSPPRRPDALLGSAGYGRPQPLVLDWMDDLEAVFLLMPA